MSGTVSIVVVVIAVAVVAASTWALVTLGRRRRLQARFGREYELAVRHSGGRREAERRLAAREDRHDQLRIRTLDPKEQDRFAKAWRTTQAGFVDHPSEALIEADSLVEEVMAERGYPVGGFEQRTADLSVEHGDVLDHYRAAHAMTERSERGRASTEEQRQAMVHYRALITALLDDPQNRTGGAPRKSSLFVRGR